MTITISHDLRPQLGPVRDQGPRPTCLAHATSAAHEFSRGVTEQLSPEYLHYFSTKGVVSSGSTFSEVRSTLEKEGQPIETDCPYGTPMGPGKWKPSQSLKLFRRQSEPRSVAVSEIERAISSGNIPVLGIAVPDPFYIPAAPWVIPANGTVRGLHALTAVGAGSLNKKRLILIRNSWGVDWGDGGHAWLDEDFLSQHLKHVLVLTHEVAA